MWPVGEKLRQRKFLPTVTGLRSPRGPIYKKKCTNNQFVTLLLLSYRALNHLENLLLCILHVMKALLTT